VYSFSTPVAACTLFGDIGPFDHYTAGTAIDQLDRSDLVFVGELVHNLPLVAAADEGDERTGWTAVFEVSKGWKGRISEAYQRVDIYLGNSCDPSGSELRLERQYLVFMRRGRANWFLLPEATSMVEALDSPSFTVRNGQVRYVHN